MSGGRSALLLGGTGSMGVSLAKVLVDKGWEVTVTSRNMHPDGDGISYVQGNAKDDAFLTKLAKCTYDAVVDFMVYSTSEFQGRVDMLLGMTPQYVFISSARVYAPAQSKITEDSPRLLDVCDDAEYLETDEYALAKGRQEDALAAAALEGNFTIVRPSITYNVHRLQLGVSEKEEWLYRALKGRMVCFPSDIADVRTSMAWGADVSWAIAMLLGNPLALGQVVQIASEESLTWGEVLEVYRGVLGEAGIELRTFSPAGSLQVGRDLGRYWQMRWARSVDREFDCSKLRSIVGDTPFTPPAEGLAKCLGDFLKNPSFLRIPWRSEAYFNKKTGERTPLGDFEGAKRRLAYLAVRYTPANCLLERG